MKGKQVLPPGYLERMKVCAEKYGEYTKVFKALEGILLNKDLYQEEVVVQVEELYNELANNILQEGL